MKMIGKARKIIIFTMILMMSLSGCNARQAEKVPGQDKVLPEQGKTLPDNDWAEGKPDEYGMDGKILDQADAYIKDNYPNIYSLVVIKDGVLVYEKYYKDKGRDDHVHVFSVTKSVISSLVGIALREKYLSGLDQKLADFYPEYYADIKEAEKKEISLKNALTMTAGFEPADKDIVKWITSEDWFAYTLNEPMIGSPGKEFNYDTGLSHLLSGVLTKATKMSTLDFAKKFLFEPMGIKNLRWGTDNKGYYGGGHLLELTPRDMAKFGYLYLKEGNWKGSQLVPADWVKESTSTQISFDENSGYGYLWWLNEKEDAKSKKKLSIYSAVGHGGQRIDVVPELDMVAVITADDRVAAKNNLDTGEILGRFIIPAVK